MKRGFTAVELLITVALLGILLATAWPPYVTLRDRASVRAATTASVSAFDAARSAALAHARHVALRLDTARALLIVHAARDTILRVGLGTSWGVRVSATRDSTAYAPDGLGYGAANLRMIVSRGAARETITVSRLGRVARR
ncbi:MAG: pilus assembly FimT family protein [Gemmatimonadaceae bacterium]